MMDGSAKRKPLAGEGERSRSRIIGALVIALGE